MDNNKICTICKLEKNKEFFRKSRNQCKECESARQQLYKQNNKKYYDDYNKQYKIDNRYSLVEQAKQYNLMHKEEKSEYNSKYFQENKEALKNYQKEHQKIKRRTVPHFRLRQNISGMINKSLKKINSSKRDQSITQYLTYSSEELKFYLESKFEFWMTWENYGVYNKNTWDDNDPSTWTWNIDHIIPQSDLPYSSMEDDNFKKCWALDNLRPYSAKQNRLDGNRKQNEP